MVTFEDGCVCRQAYQIYLITMLKSLIQSLLSHPMSRHLNLDSPELTIQRFRLVKQKPFLNKFYQDCYRSIAGAIPPDSGGSILELGSGGGFIKDFVPDSLTSEILQIPNVDVILDGQRLPFGNDSLRGIVMLDVFHHLPSVRLFLKEASRCVRQGGVIAMIEPWNTIWSRFVYRRLHHEPFDTGCVEWELPKGGPLSEANSALPWLVFKRDRIRFEQKFPQWQIQDIRLHSPFCYLLSGGLSYRSFMPGRLFQFCRRIEFCLQPFLSYLAMFALIILIRK